MDDKYQLNVYRVAEPPQLVASFKSPLPFPAILKGHRLDSKTLSQIANANQGYGFEVVAVEHQIEATQEQLEKLYTNVYVEPIQPPPPPPKCEPDKRPPSRLFHYGGEGLLNALLNCELKLSFATDFDDPFEHMPQDKPEWESYDPKDGSYADLVQRKCSENDALICFTGLENDILMWSHYGDQHRGIMLTLNFEAQPLKDFLEKGFVGRVDYQGERVQTTMGVIPYTQDQHREELRHLLFRKATCWEKQDEYRMLVPAEGIQNYTVSQDGKPNEPKTEKDPTKPILKSIAGKIAYVLSINHECIEKVTLGCRSKPQLEAALRRIKAESNAPWAICRAKPKPKTFELEKKTLVEGRNAKTEEPKRE